MKKIKIKILKIKIQKKKEVGLKKEAMYGIGLYLLRQELYVK